MVGQSFSILDKFPIPIFQNVLLKNFSTFRIGGPANYFTKISSLEEAKRSFSFIYENQIPFFVIGYGSNCLFDDRGFNGLVILNRLNHFEHNLETHEITVESGFPLSLLGKYCAEKGLKGMEFANGIPGTVGGAIFMNAGCGENNTASHLQQVRFINASGQEIHVFKKDLHFGYRSSQFQNDHNCFITSGTFKLSSHSETLNQFLLLKKKRLLTQPYREKSAGCIFRNPSGIESAGKLIDDCGCKGLRKGQAEVSLIHANFIINKGEAQSKDVLSLINFVKTIVFEKTGILLQEEVKIVPYSLTAF